MLKDFLAMLFPDFCASCHGPLVKGEEMVCIECRYNLPQTDFHLRQENELLAKFSSKVLLKYTLAYLKFTKNGQVQRLLHVLKYEDNPEIGRLLGKWYGDVLKGKQFDQEFDGIIPVPLHPKRLKQRGYNQSACFAQGLAEVMDIPVWEEVLLRTKATETQTKKSKLERWMNVKHVFAVQNQDLIHQKRVLLVDDVLTTGSTLEACLDVLHQNHCKELSIATVAVAN